MSDDGFLSESDLYEGIEIWAMYIEPDNTFYLGNIFLPMRVIKEYPRFWLCEVLPHKNPEGFGISKVYPMTLCKHSISIREIIIRKMM